MNPIPELKLTLKEADMLSLREILSEETTSSMPELELLL
jgi:hypothetical protein